MMATIKERVDADLQAARDELTAAQAKVASLEQQAVNLPAEIHQLDESVWTRIKSFFGVQ